MSFSDRPGNPRPPGRRNEPGGKPGQGRSSLPATNGRRRGRPRIQLVCYALLGVALAYVLIARYARPLTFDRGIGIEPARVGQVEQRIDPNTARWGELARLPNIGETLAKRIVAYRNQQRAGTEPGQGSGVVFSSLEDLRAIRGIGPKTLDQLADYLKLPAPGRGCGD